MRLSISAIVVLMFSMAAFPARAQVLIDGINATGIGTAKRAPDVLRVQVQLSAEGKTLKEALAKLAGKREACKKKLASLGAKDESIAFEDAKIDTPDPQQQAQIMARPEQARVPRHGLAVKRFGLRQPALLVQPKRLIA